MTPERTASFNYWTGIIGLIASLITIYGFVVGLVTLDILPPLLRKPVPLTTVSFVFLFYFSVLIIYAICSRRTAHKLMDSNHQFIAPIPAGYFFLITTLVWVPIFLVWATLVYDLNDLANTHTTNLFSPPAMLAFAGMFSTYFIWLGITYVEDSNRDELKKRTEAADGKYTNARPLA